MRALLWIIVATMIVLFFAGDKVRGYLKGSDEVAETATQPQAAKQAGAKVPGKAEDERRSSSGAYAPSPADAPELYESPTRRLGF